MPRLWFGEEHEKPRTNRPGLCRFRPWRGCGERQVPRCPRPRASLPTKEEGEVAFAAPVVSALRCLIRSFFVSPTQPRPPTSRTRLG